MTLSMQMAQAVLDFPGYNHSSINVHSQTKFRTSLKCSKRKFSI